jgi:hypothetical protein
MNPRFPLGAEMTDGSTGSPLESETFNAPTVVRFGCSGFAGNHLNDLNGLNGLNHFLPQEYRR